MWFPSDVDLLDGMDTEGKFSLLLCQAWHQLLASESPDAYRAKVMDLPLLLEELSEVATLAIEDQRLEGHLGLICAEIEDAMKVEEGFLGGRPGLRSHLTLLTSRQSTTRPRQTRDQVNVIRSLWGNTLEVWCEDAKRLLEEAIQSGNKSALLHRLSCMATHVLKAEAQRSALAVLSDDAISRSPRQVLADICEACVGADRSYECFIAVRGSRSDLFSTIHGLDFDEPKRRRVVSHQGGLEWLESSPGRNTVVTTQSARSSRLAAELALERLSGVTNLHNLYKNSDSLRPSTDVLAVDLESGAAEVVRVTPGVHFGLKPRRSYAKLTRDRYAAMGSRLEGRIANALEAHTLALAAEDAKISLLNLWTALETLAGPVGPTSIGARVADRISPIITWRRVDRIVTSLTIDLNETCRLLAVKRDHEIFPASSSNWIASDDVFTALTGPVNNSTIRHIFALLSDRAPLLTHQIYESWRGLHDPTVLKSRYAKSQQRIVWQIHRIYRARNLLVHQGKSHRVIWRLLQNAQYYLSTALGRVLHDLSSNHGWTIDSSLEYQRMRYEYVVGGLGKQSKLIRSDLLAGKTDRPDDYVWAVLPEVVQEGQEPASGRALPARAIRDGETSTQEV